MRRPAPLNHWPSPLSLWGGAIASGLATFVVLGFILARAPRLMILPPVVGAAVGYWRFQRRLPGAGLPPELAERVRVVARREQLICASLQRMPQRPDWAEVLPRLVANHHQTAIQLAEAEALLVAEAPSALAMAEAEFRSSQLSAPSAVDDLARREAGLQARREARQELVELATRITLRLGLLEDCLAVISTGVATASEPSAELFTAVHEAEAAMQEASASLAGQNEVRALTQGRRPPKAALLPDGTPPTRD